MFYIYLPALNYLSDPGLVLVQGGNQVHDAEHGNHSGAAGSGQLP